MMVFTHAESVEFVACFVFLISDAELDTKFCYKKAIVFMPQQICIVAC